MPIRFRCSSCTRLLGIATRKAGTETMCPHCGAAITVPAQAVEPTKTERLNLDDVDRLLGHMTERVTEPATQVLEPPRAEAPADQPKRATPKAKSRSAAKLPAVKPESKAATPHDDPPLFENDLDEIFGPSSIPREDERPKPRPVSSKDSHSLEDVPRALVISPQKATLIMGGVVVLLALAFAAGYFVAR